MFGSRLLRLLARQQKFRLTLAGRNESRAVALAEELRDLDSQGEFAFLYLDRDEVTAERLVEARCDLVVDCSGPFQTSGTALVEAAIAARCHYVDLADARDWVAGIARFDSAARLAGVSVTAGASTTPALTHAVVDMLTAAWLSIDSIDVAILPGNRTARGPAVVEAILSWVGRPVRVFSEGLWQDRPGWGMSRRVRADGIGSRLATLVDVPDLDLLAQRYQPRLRAGFEAGLELPVLHHLVGLAGWPTRLGLLPNARWAARPGITVSRWLSRLGSDHGGMIIDIAGQDARGDFRLVRWTLVAGSGQGPFVPVLAAASLVDVIAAGRGPRIGARSAAGLLPLDTIRPWTEGLDIRFGQVVYRGEKPLLLRVMGAALDGVPLAVRRWRRGRPAVIAEGQAGVAPAASVAGRVLARLAGLPRQAGIVPVRAVIEAREGREFWRFDIGEVTVRFTLRAIKSAPDLIELRFGGLVARFRPVVHSAGLDMVPVSLRWRGLPLAAEGLVWRELAQEDGRVVVDFEATLPLAGRIFAFRAELPV